MVVSETGCLAGRAILVTGAGDGLGRAAAKSFAAQGAEVVLLGRTPAKLEGVYDEIVAAGGPQPAIYPLDLAGATPKEYRDLANTLREEVGHLEGLLHNAAILELLTPLDSHPFDVWERTMRANVTGPFVLTQACLPLLTEAADASVIFTGDECMTKPKGYWGAYGVSKAGVHNMALMLAQELSHTHVRVNVVDPGPARTAMRLRTHPGAPLSSWPLPEDLMGPYVALMRADSGQSGQVICVQAGV
ncbi:MAG: SDR family NAD(P)-dependent oxidoreductase [Gammaproteobacteria bacterium]|nr:SDR family NAD(P)-dependent oxidoreductase [Gammaproteobacteria bacterium]